MAAAECESLPVLHPFRLISHTPFVVGLYHGILLALSLLPHIRRMDFTGFIKAGFANSRSYVLLGFILNEMTNIWIKLCVQAERPCPNLKFDYGFPSSHAQFMGFYLAHSALTWWNMSLAATVCFARIYMRLHTCGQVLAGLVLGHFLGLMWRSLSKEAVERLRKAFHETSNVRKKSERQFDTGIDQS